MKHLDNAFYNNDTTISFSLSAIKFVTIDSEEHVQMNWPNNADPALIWNLV